MRMAWSTGPSKAKMSRSPQKALYYRVLDLWSPPYLQKATLEMPCSICAN